jgi:hypothetical protein
MPALAATLARTSVTVTIAETTTGIAATVTATMLTMMATTLMTTTKTAVARIAARTEPEPGKVGAKMLSWPDMRASRFEAAAALLAVGLLWGCSGSPGGPTAETSGSPEPIVVTGDTAPADAAPSESPAASAADSAADTAPGPLAGDAAATYHVPVPEELEPYSTFELGDLRLRERGAEWELDYTLPELLVGGSERLSFRGGSSSNGDIQLRGDAGQLSCRSLGAAMQCDEVLTKLEVDRDKLERAFATLPAAEREARRAVADRFSDDPIGVLTFSR